MPGDAEARILALERVVYRLPRRIEGLEAGVGALRQRIATARPTTTTAFNCRFTGTVTACGSTPMAGALVTITDEGTLEVLWTGTADDSGVYAGAIYIAAGATLSVEVVAVDPPYYPTRLKAAVSFGATLVEGDNTIPVIGGASGVGGTNMAQTGYTCNSMCYAPLKTSLTLTDDDNGAMTLTLTGLVWRRQFLIGATVWTYELSLAGVLTVDVGGTDQGASGSWTCDPFLWTGSYGAGVGVSIEEP